MAITKDTPLTFGKYQGWTPAELAQAGQTGLGYLNWGVDKLKSPQWRDAFEEALRHVQLNEHLAAKAMTVDNPDLPYDEALRFIQAEIAEELAWREYTAVVEDREAAILNKWSAVMGVPTAKLRELARQFEGDDVRSYPLNRFSSPQRREDLALMMEEWEQRYDGVDAPL